MASSIASVAGIGVAEELDIRLGRVNDPGAKARLRIIDNMMGGTHADLVARALKAGRFAFGIDLQPNDETYDPNGRNMLYTSAIRYLIAARRMRPVNPPAA